MGKGCYFWKIQVKLAIYREIKGHVIIKNLFFVDIMQNFKILQIVFMPKTLYKANYKFSKMKVLKDTFQQSFKLHIYW